MGRILLYHRVAEIGADPHAICVAPGRFRAQLELLAREYRPVRYSDLLGAAEAGDVPERAVAVSFDDGYEDNLLEALPLLAEHGVPAIVFAATATLDTEEEFWWDRLEALLLAPGHLPRRLELYPGGRRFETDLGASAVYGAADAARHAGWSHRDAPPPTRRHQAFVRLFRRLQRLEAADRERALAALRELAGRPTAVRPSHRPLGPEQLARLAESPLVEIGAHTVSHPRLSRIGRRARGLEISEGKRRLEELVGPVRHFAYPFGDARRSVGRVRSAGFDSAATTRPGRVDAGSDRYRLPRLYVGDWGPERLARTLERADDGAS